MSYRTPTVLAIFLWTIALVPDTVTAQGKVGYRGQGRYAGAKPTPVAPTTGTTRSSQTTPGAVGYYGAPPTDYRVDPYNGGGSGIVRYPHSTLVDPYGNHQPRRPAHQHSHYGGSYVIPYYVPIYVPAQPAFYEEPRASDAFYEAPDVVERPAPAPVVVVVQAPGGSTPAVGEDLGSLPPSTPASKPLAHPTTPEPPKAPAGPGRIELAVHPLDAAVYLDDHLLGSAAEVAAKGGALRADSGVHVLEVRHAGHAPERLVFGISSEVGVRIEVDLSGKRLARRSMLEPLRSSPPLIEFGS